jgi:hypothetical protein
MALRKNKNEIIDRIITKSELGDDYYCGWDDECDDCHSCYCDDCHYCINNFEYLPDDLQPKPVTHIIKRGIRISQQTYSPGKMIDMTSIYSKEVLRQKRINHILGIELLEHSRPTFADILNIKK